MAIIKYDGGGKPGGTVKESISYDGGKTWNGSGASGAASSGSSSGTSKTGQSSGWNNYTGATGKQYNVAGSNGTIQVTYKDGTTRTVLPTDADYVATSQAMQSDLSGNGINYTPNYTFTNQNGTYTTKDYVNGNNDLQYALQQAAKQSSGGYWKPNVGTHTGNTGKTYTIGDDDSIQIIRTDGTTAYVKPSDANYKATVQAMNADGVKSGIQINYNNAGLSTADYIKSLYNRIGTKRADGTTVTLADVDKELDRLGLSDYNSQNAIYTAGGSLLPGNQFVTQHTGADGSNSADSRWLTYGGQDYLAGANGGDSSNWAQYVNGKTGNLDNLSFIFGNMQNNPYAQQDTDFLTAYLNAQNQFNAAGGVNAGTGTSYSPTGNANVDNVINYVNSLNNYSAASGGNGGTSSLLDMLQSYLNSGLTANQDFIAQQKAQAEQAAQKQASDAWVNSQIAQRSLKEQLSALGMGTSGALQSGQMALQGDYGNNLATINTNLNTMLSNLSQQELQVLSDYYNNMANYAYQVTNDEADRALQQAQLALQQQQAAYDQQYQAQQLAMQQAQWEWQKQQAAYEQEQNRKLQQAAYYQSMYDNGSLSDAGLVNALSNLGLISGGYWPNGSYTNGSTIGQAQRQQAANNLALQEWDLSNAPLQQKLLQAELQAQLLANKKASSKTKNTAAAATTPTLPTDPFA